MSATTPANGYPPNWKEISRAIRERAGDRCECEGECGLHRDHPGPPTVPKNTITRLTLKTCPDRETIHTPAPEGYVQWHEWAAQKAKTHRQKQCPTCGLFAVWVPRAQKEASTP